jgi:hypothetical protein
VSTYRVTHLDQHGRRHQVLLECTCRAAAEALAEAMYGAALYMAAVRLRGLA